MGTASAGGKASIIEVINVIGKIICVNIRFLQTPASFTFISFINQHLKIFLLPNKLVQKVIIFSFPFPVRLRLRGRETKNYGVQLFGT